MPKQSIPGLHKLFWTVLLVSISFASPPRLQPAWVLWVRWSSWASAGGWLRNLCMYLHVLELRVQAGAGLARNWNQLARTQRSESFPSLSGNTRFWQGKVLPKQCLGLGDGGKAAGTGRLLAPLPRFPLRVTFGMATIKEKRLKTPRSCQNLKRSKAARRWSTNNSRSSSKYQGAWLRWC